MESETKIEFIGGAALVLHILETLNLRGLLNDHFSTYKNWTGIYRLCVA